MTFLPVVEFKKGAYVTIETAPNPGRFYIISKGIAQVAKEHGAIHERKSSILGPGDIFAVIACLTGHNETETVYAQSDLKLLAVDRLQLVDLAQNNKKMVMKIIKQLVSDIRILNTILTGISLFGKIKREFEEKDPSTRLYHAGTFYQSKEMFNQAYHAYHRCVQYYPDSPFTDTAKQEMQKIKPNVTQEKFDYPKEEFRRVYPKNTMFFVEGEPSKELFFILKGRVKVSCIKENTEINLAFLKSGDMCGKLAMLEGLPHTTNAMSIDECETLAVGPMGFDTMMKSQPQLLFRLCLMLAEQAWFLNKKITNRYLSDPLVRLYDILAVMLEKERVIGKEHRFRFGLSELIDMAGYTEENCGDVIKKLLSDNLVLLDENGQIRVIDSVDIIRKNEANWKEPRLLSLN
jgi:CRP-like cAMP-binding protein